jgi:hypothetical protein
MYCIVQKLCSSNGTSCNLDINHPALNASANDVLKVVWACTW